MPVGGINVLPPGGSGKSGSAKLPRVQGGMGLLAGDNEALVARSLELSGPLRGRNLDGVLGHPEFGTVSLDVVLARATINAAGGAQQIQIIEEVEECDILELQFFNLACPHAVAQVRS